MFAVYALLLAGWGLWRAHAHASAGASARSADPADDAAGPAEPPVAHERGAAARRHLSTLP